MDIVQIKIFVRVCFLYASKGYLNLENGQLICLYKECLAMACHYKDIVIQFNGCTLLGELYKSMNQYTEAIQYHERCLQIATREGMKSGEAAAYSNLGRVHVSLNKYPEAIHFYEKALDNALH
jgi:tetratricopeptide (TPR) repeat protein